MPAQFTRIRNRPTLVPPQPLALRRRPKSRRRPRGEQRFGGAHLLRRSSTTTMAPRSTSVSTVAAPSPEVPPVTIATVPSICIVASFALVDRLIGGNQRMVGYGLHPDPSEDTHEHDARPPPSSSSRSSHHCGPIVPVMPMDHSRNDRALRRVRGDTPSSDVRTRRHSLVVDRRSSSRPGPDPAIRRRLRRPRRRPACALPPHCR